MKPWLILTAAFGVASLPSLLLGGTSGQSGHFQPLRIEQTWEPEYPLTATAVGILNGEVTVVVAVDESGHLADALVTYASHPAFERAAMEAVRKWRFVAARYDGKPVGVTQPIKFNFEERGAVIVEQTASDNMLSRIRDLRQDSDAYHSYSIREIDHDLTPVHLAVPVYAQDLRSRGISGMVKLYYYVDQDGRVRMPIVANDAPPELAQAAIAAAREWRFAPPTHYGQPCLVRVSQGINFGAKS